MVAVGMQAIMAPAKQALATGQVTG